MKPRPFRGRSICSLKWRRFDYKKRSQYHYQGIFYKDSKKNYLLSMICIVFTAFPCIPVQKTPLKTLYSMPKKNGKKSTVFIPNGRFLVKERARACIHM